MLVTILGYKFDAYNFRNLRNRISFDILLDKRSRPLYKDLLNKNIIYSPDKNNRIIVNKHSIDIF